MSWYTCSDCDYMNLQDKNKYDEAYCSKRHHYYKPSDTICNLSSIKGRDVGGSSNCYLTTAVCNILGYEDNYCFLQELRFFRDNYMRNEVDCYDLLKEYKELGPQICNKLENDLEKDQIAWIMLEHYIKPAVIQIQNKNFDNAIQIYIEMTNNLISKYEIKTEDHFRRSRKIKNIH